MKKKKRRSASVSLVLVPILLSTGCSYDPNDGPPLQRDVYTKFEDCVADWGKPELCQKIAEAEAAQFAQDKGVTSGGTGGGVSPMIFWGPSYYSPDRAVAFNGQTYAPLQNRAMSKPFQVTSTSSAIAKASPGAARTSNISRGGFGSSGRAVGGAHSSGG